MKTYSQNIIVGLFLGTISASEVTQESEGWRLIKMAQHQNDHPYGAGYQEDMMGEPFYANTWQHTNHPHLGNETAYVADAPADYHHPSVEAHSLSQGPSRLSQMQQR